MRQLYDAIWALLTVRPTRFGFSETGFYIRGISQKDYSAVWAEFERQKALGGLNLVEGQLLGDTFVAQVTGLYKLI